MSPLYTTRAHRTTPMTEQSIQNLSITITTGKMLMDFADTRMRRLRTSIFHRLRSSKKIEDLQQPQASKYTAVSSSATASAAHQRLSACSAHHRLRKKKLTRGNGSALCQTQPVQN